MALTFSSRNLILPLNPQLRDFLQEKLVMLSSGLLLVDRVCTWMMFGRPITKMGGQRDLNSLGSHSALVSKRK